MDTDTAWNLGVIFDSDFRFDQQMNSVVKSSSYKLSGCKKKKKRKIKPVLEKVIHAFIWLTPNKVQLFLYQHWLTFN